MEKRTRQLIGLGLIALVLFGPGAIWLIRMEFRQRQLDQELARLKAKREQLAAEEARLRSDPAYVEGLIRTTFKVARPDELVIPLEADGASGKTR
jgi:cell division protein FtsB